jgi:hypothetical protein
MLHKEYAHIYVGLFGDTNIYARYHNNRHTHMWVSLREVAYIHGFEW